MLNRFKRAWNAFQSADIAPESNTAREFGSAQSKATDLTEESTSSCQTAATPVLLADASSQTEPVIQKPPSSREDSDPSALTKPPLQNRPIKVMKKARSYFESGRQNPGKLISNFMFIHLPTMTDIQIHGPARSLG
ncbi:hypothetical protein V5O48_009929 [Marasmius crinis-equi]|uniref:Uncharacterized protein n=1 Tax=Marasmius crinis-equi TaxID=585013 RepID=A0ABR3F9Q4_9AGAR